MFGIGLPEMILIMALALIVVGPDKLPDLARSVAKGVLDLKKTVSSLKENLEEEMELDTVKPELEELSRSLQEKLTAPAANQFQGILPDTGINGDTVSAPPAPEKSETVIDIEIDTPDHSEIRTEQQDDHLAAAQEPEPGTRNERTPGNADETSKPPLNS